MNKYKPYKCLESAAYIDKNGDLIFTSLGGKQNVLCIKDRSEINTHAIAENYRPQILCNRQCAKCNITAVTSISRYDASHWIITTCGVKHYFKMLYVWQDDQYKVQVTQDRAVAQEDLKAYYAECSAKARESENVSVSNKTINTPAPQPVFQGPVPPPPEEDELAKPVLPIKGDVELPKPEFMGRELGKLFLHK